jgi:alkylhydroperoxidase/carboxymuconolactone decarboxylase family protein YurZ
MGEQEGRMSLSEETYQKFREFFDSAHADGALDKKTKELIHLAVVLALHCEP